MFRAPIYKSLIQAEYQTIKVQNMNKLNTELINNLNQIKSLSQQKLNGKD